MIFPSFDCKNIGTSHIFLFIRWVKIYVRLKKLQDFERMFLKRLKTFCTSKVIEAANREPWKSWLRATCNIQHPTSISPKSEVTTCIQHNQHPVSNIQPEPIGTNVSSQSYIRKTSSRPINESFKSKTSEKVLAIL